MMTNEEENKEGQEKCTDTKTNVEDKSIKSEEREEKLMEKDEKQNDKQDEKQDEKKNDKQDEGKIGINDKVIAKDEGMKTEEVEKPSTTWVDLTNNRSEIEEKLGIKSYVSDKKLAFKGIFKARYSDFIVRELDLEGNIASIIRPAIESESQDEVMIDNKESRKIEFENVKNQLSEIINNKEEAQVIIEMLMNPNPEKKNHTLPPIIDKEKRRSFYTFLRETKLLNELCIADTTEEKSIRIWYKPYFSSKKSSHYKEYWPKDRPNFCKFVLYKENIDTVTACKDIGRYLGLYNTKTSIEFAGMKDKRGITCQYCTIYRRSIDQLQKLNEKFNFTTGRLRLDNFCYVEEPLKLGKLSGNRFDVALRHVTTDDLSVIQKSIDDLKQFGYINYFGMQRFGKFHDTHLVGKAALEGNFQEAVEIIMSPKFPPETPIIHNARMKWKNRFHSNSNLSKKEAEKDVVEEISPIFRRFMIAEQAILKTLSNFPCDYKRAFLSIPHNTKLMYGHAVQSLIWNVLASYRIDASKQEREHDASSSKQFKPMIGDLVLTSKETSGLKGKTVEYITEENINKFSMRDVVIPLPGTEVQYPKNTSGSIDKILHKEIGLTTQDFIQQQTRELCLGGDYRKLICIPKDVTFELIKYQQDTDPLIVTDYMKISDTNLVKSEAESKQELHQGMIISFTLSPSAYATQVIREFMKCPTSTDFQTELMKLHGLYQEEISREDSNDQTKDGNENDRKRSFHRAGYSGGRAPNRRGGGGRGRGGRHNKNKRNRR